MDTVNTPSIAELDRGNVLHPFTRLDTFAHGESPITIVEGGRGVRITDSEGRSYIDGFAGLYCVNIGYGREEVAEAIAAQARKLAYYHCYAGHTTEGLARLSDRLVRMAPGRMSKVFYGLSGSDANETNVKLVWHYHNLIGRPAKKKIIARQRGYHGCSIVSGSLTGMSFYHDHMDLPVPGILHTEAPHYYWGAQAQETEEAFSLRRAAELEALILREGPDTVAAFIAEPVLGTGGLTPPPHGYWTAIQEVLRKYEILLIADEVICGFGRIGTPFGSHLYDMRPDLITAAKGLTAAYAPLSASIMSQQMYEVMEKAAPRIGAFSHGYTYSGHPIGVAAANAVLDILEREKLVDLSAQTGQYLQRKMREAFSGLPIVGEVRGVGMLAAIEFLEDPTRKQRFDPTLGVGGRISAAVRKRGLIARAMPHGDILGFAPPLIMSTDEIDEMIDITRAGIVEVMETL